ncbi:uncharacterized protein LOC118201016 [Stegodyphus dumicola]|uniref:uncharacterized protein LOC118201016 n=1 Tax=Stegodyphus dumicola TaxID=202533 RepID=UPI0015AE06E8|nr:uncharacterized protein LOC118201016 [Stegodyphus dumicola]
MGDSVQQLVLPKSRRKDVLKLAHESVFGAHMGIKKTKERIRYNFYWPNMNNDITEYCLSCEPCQLRSTEKITDRIPITPVLRPYLPFEVVNIDIIGPIEPPSARKHKYVLCLMDQHSRWPEAIPLRSLTAKATCDALLEIFTRTGIPKIIASDQGTNFISQLTQEFMKRLGCHPRFSVPGYPASNGLVERYNRVLKNALHHIIRMDPSNWDKYLPYLLFAYREVPNSTTGVSPFKLMYGREIRGPLSVLKSSWSGEIPIPLNMKQSVVDYLQEMKINLERAADQASLIASEKQAAYSNYFNRRAIPKEFKVGDKVYLLIPDSSNKLYARWTGPGKIIKYCPPHSYKVKLSDGKVKHVHVNKIRKYIARVNAVGVIFENEEEFGEIHPTPQASSQDMEVVLQKLQLEHLTGDQQQQIKQLIRKHESLFTGKVKIAKVGFHKIKLKPNQERKKPHIYRIPETLKSKVDEQIEELLELDLIEESSAEIAYPIVCVNKKDGGIRLCVDYRALNSVTITDDFPMQNASELIHSIGQANIISTLDLLRGYWAIPMDPESRDYTSFKTHRQQYRFKVMSFGLKNAAAATFQREINKALHEYKDFARAYIDDIAIFSKDWKSHMVHLDMILTKLEELRFTVNISKCDFAKPQIKYLGHVIGSGKHQADPEKIEAISRLSKPKTKKQLRSLLGLCNYYRDYIPKYSELVYPLTELTKKKIPEEIPWKEEHDIAFERTQKCSD